MAGFLRALGWSEAPSSESVHRVFQGTNGIVVALYAASNYEPHFGPRADGFRAAVLGLLTELDEHIVREDLGIFPVSVVTLGAAGWATVERAHQETPSFLEEGAFP